MNNLNQTVSNITTDKNQSIENLYIILFILDTYNNKYGFSESYWNINYINELQEESNLIC